MTKKKHPGGRPTKMTALVVKKLEEAFMLGCSDLEACLYAEISKQTLYNYQDKFPEFVDRKQLLKENPCMLARVKVIEGIKEDYNLAFNYLKSKKSEEFTEKRSIEVSGTIGLSQAMDQAEQDNGIIPSEDK